MRRGSGVSDGAEFVLQYAPVLNGPRGESFVARTYMRHQRGGLWEGWLAFLSLQTGIVVETERETTQGKREHLLYWASGLEPTYLRGALERALRRRTAVRRSGAGTAAERRACRALVQASIDAAFRRRGSAQRHRRRAAPRPGRPVKIDLRRPRVVASARV